MQWFVLERSSWVATRRPKASSRAIRGRDGAYCRCAFSKDMVDRMLMIMNMHFVFWIGTKKSAVKNWRTREKAETDVWSPETE